MGAARSEDISQVGMALGNEVGCCLSQTHQSKTSGKRGCRQSKGQSELTGRALGWNHGNWGEGANKHIQETVRHIAKGAFPLDLEEKQVLEVWDKLEQENKQK